MSYTTDPNLRGGFQIIPANHAKYLYYNLNQTQGFIGHAQWMIVAQVGADKSLLQNPAYTIGGKLSYDPGRTAQPWNRPT